MVRCAGHMMDCTGINQEPGLDMHYTNYTGAQRTRRVPNVIKRQFISPYPAEASPPHPPCVSCSVSSKAIDSESAGTWRELGGGVRVSLSCYIQLFGTVKHLMYR